jgi:O-antigen ligase
MPWLHHDLPTLVSRADALLALAAGAATGLVLGVVVVDGGPKVLLACLGVVFLALSVVYPRLIVYVLVVLVTCLSQTEFGVQATQSVFRLSSYTLNPVRLNLYEILIYCLLVILVARRALGRLPRGVPGWLTVPCVLTGSVMLLQLARALVAGFPYFDTVSPFNGRYVLAAVVALWCFAELLGELSARLRVLDLLYVCATGRAVFALVRFFFAGGDTANAYRGSGVKVALWESADHLLFAFLIVVLIAAWATGRIAGRRIAFWAGGSALMAATIALSYRRTSWLGLTAALVLASVVLLRRHQRSLALVGVVVAALGGIVAASYTRFRSGAGLMARLFPDVVSRVGPTRQDEWALAWQTILHNPIAGALTARRVASRFAYWDTSIVHNAFLFAWMKFGLAGLLSLCWLAVTCVVYAIRGVRMRISEDFISLGALSIVPFALALAMFELPLVELRTVLVLALTGALAVRVVCDSDGHGRDLGRDALLHEEGSKPG